MSNTGNPNICPKCNAVIPPEAPQGLCPKCVLGGAAAADPAPTATSQIPSLERLAVAFPQLQIIELIGRGGMGFVFKARQPHLDRFVALKLLPDSLAHDPQFAERFNREGRTLARLNHPNIVSIFDFGQAGGFYFLLMEYVDGVNLRQAMQAGRFSPSEALAIVPKICEALQFAHEEGILHRDIKPENILLDAKGRVKIADFGIAKIVGEDKPDVSLTATGAALGTPHYMAPEQFEKPATVDHRADIYSLGVVFYEMLTGELPIGRFSPPSQRTPVDPRVDDVVMRTLEKEREKRFQSAGEMRTTVEHLTDTGAGNFKGSSAPPKAAAGESGPRGTMVINPSAVTPAMPGWSLKAVWGAVLVAISLVPILALLVFIAYFAANHRFPPLGGPEVILLLVSLLLSLPAIAGTILGWMGLNDIRAHKIKRRGLPLAVFAALAWPDLIVLSIGLALPLRLMVPMDGNGIRTLSATLMLPVAVGTITFVIWTVYAAVRWGANQPSPERRGKLKWIFAMLMLGGLGFIALSTFVQVRQNRALQQATAVEQIVTAPNATDAPWIRFTFTAVELRELKGVRWLAIDYLDDVHGKCEKSFPWETTIPGFKAETRTTEFITDAKDGSPSVRHQRIEYRMPDSSPRDQLERLRDNLEKALKQKSFRLELGENEVPLTLFELPGAEGGSLKARIKVMPPLKSITGNNDAVERRISLARQQLDAAQQRVNAGVSSQSELVEARRDVELAEARGDAVLEARAKLKYAEYAVQVAHKQYQARVISFEEVRTAEIQKATAEIELQQALRKKPVEPTGPAPQKPDAAALQFRLVADRTNNDSPVDVMVQPQEKGPAGQLRVLRTVLLDGSSVARAGVDFDAKGSRVIGVELTAEGARQFGAITAANINRQLAIIAGGKVLSAPVIRTAITGELQISGEMPATEMYGLLGSLNGHPTGLQFSPPVERSLPRARETQTEAVGLDLDLSTYMTNRLFSTSQRAAIFSFETNGVDLLAAGTNDRPASLVALGSVLIEAPAGAWDSMPAEEVGWNWKLMRGVAKDYSKFGVAPGGSDTFMFRTHENGFGLLQFLPTTNSAPNVKIRYKLVQADTIAPVRVRALLRKLDAATEKAEDEARPEAMFPQLLAFSPTIERILYDYKSGKDWLLNLESGETFSLPPGMNWDNDAAAVWRWAHKQGIHVTGLNVASQHGLYGFEMKAAIVRETNVTFEAITTTQIAAALKGSLTSKSTHNGGPPLYQLSGKDWNDLYAFETDEGRTGVLQVTGFVENPRGVKFRYKLVQSDGTTVAKPTAREEFDAASKRFYAGRLSQYEFAEAERRFAVAEAQGDAVAAARMNLNFAQTALTETKRRVEVGVLAPLELKFAESRLALAETDLADAQLQALRKREQELRAIYTDQHPMVQSIRQQIVEAEQEKARRKKTQ